MTSELIGEGIVALALAAIVGAWAWMGLRRPRTVHVGDVTALAVAWSCPWTSTAACLETNCAFWNTSSSNCRFREWAAHSDEVWSGESY